MSELEVCEEYMRFWEIYNSKTEKEFIECFNDEKSEY
jgi:hypothetical protein